MTSPPIYWRANGGYQSAPQPDLPARTWRANGGYQDVEASSPPQPEQQQTPMYWPPWYCTQWTGQQYMRGPVPVNGVFGGYPQQMPTSWYGWGTPPGYATPPPPYVTPPPPAEEKKEEEEKKDEGKQDEEQKVENPDAPPKLDEGMNYMFDNGHTMLHIFNKAAPIWEEKYHKQEL